MLAFLDLTKLLTFTLIGLSTGAIYAVIASGLVVTYTTSGIFNLAHGATGVLGAYTYWQFRFGWDWPAPLALALVVLILCPLFGAATEALIMRGLRETTEVVRLSVTVALLAGMLGLTNWLWRPTTTRAYRGFFEGSKVRIGDVNISWHKIITMGCAIAVALGLRLLMYRSRAGVMMRAVVDDRDLAELNGGRPDRSAMLAWAISASLAGLAGILLIEGNALTIEPLVVLVINAFAAAIIGRLRNLPMTFLGAILLGLLDSYYLGYGKTDWKAFGFSLNGLRSALPIIVLFVALVLVPHSRLRVGVPRLRDRRPAPQWSTSLLGAGLLIAFVVAISGLLTRTNQLHLIGALIFALAALSLVPLTGYAGAVSLAPLTFAGLGAIAMAKLPGNGNLLSLLGAVVIVAAIGAIVAVPALRLSGIYLALTTAAFAVLVSKLVFAQKQTFNAGNITVPALRLPGVDIGSPRSRLILLAVAFALIGLGVVALRRSRLGRQLIALKDSPAAAATLGMNITYTRVAAFAISAAIASTSGALAGTQVRPDQYDFTFGLPVVLLAVVGGVSSVAGALFGGLLLGGNGVLAAIAPAMRNLSRVMPGTIGITLGRRPEGATEQIAENYRPLLERWSLVAVSIAGGAIIWGLTNQGTISHWSFVFGLMIWVAAVVPNLPALTAAADGRTLSAGAWLAAFLAAGLFIDWGTALHSSGWRLIVLIALIGFSGPIAARFLDRTPRVTAESPDAIGLTRPFTSVEIEEAERRLGVSIP